MIRRLISGINKRLFTMSEMVDALSSDHIEVQTLVISNPDTAGQVTFSKPIKGILSVSLRQGDLTVIERYSHPAVAPGSATASMTVDVTPGEGEPAHFFIIALVGP